MEGRPIPPRVRVLYGHLGGRNLCYITVDPDGLFHHDCPVLDPGPFRSLAEALAVLRVEYMRMPVWGLRLLYADAYGQTFPLVRKSLLSRAPWSGWKYHLTLKGGLFNVHPPEIGGPFRGLGEAVAAVERHRLSLTPPRAAEASLPPAPAAQALLTPAPAHEASLAPPPASLTLAPAHEAPLTPPPAAEASNPPTYAWGTEEYWRAEERERGRQYKLYLSQVDPAELAESIKSTLTMLMDRRQKVAEPVKKPVEKSWMATVIDKLNPATTDPAVEKACDYFERLVEEEETIESGMKWMKKEVLQAFEIYRSSAGYSKNVEYEFVKIDFQCLLYDTFPKSYHHYNFTMRTRQSPSKQWNHELFFAEVKPTEDEREYFCCPLRPSEDGHCFGCRKVGISLRHPDSGGYEKGHPGSGFPFDTY